MDSMKQKIAIVYTQFGEGGISSALAALLREIADDKGLDITLYLFSKENGSRFSIPENVKIIEPSDVLRVWFSQKENCRGLEKLYWYIMHFIGLKISMKPIENTLKRIKPYEEYDVAIAYSNDINSKCYLNLFCNDFVEKCIIAKKKIGWTHNDPYRLGYNADFLKWRYKNYDTIVNVSRACKKKFDEIAPFYTDKSAVVHNCVYERPIEGAVKKKSEKDGLFHIVSVSRIDNNQKRIDRAIEATKYLKEKGYQNKIIWHMFGSGPDEKKLRSYVSECGVDDMFVFQGSTGNPVKEMAEADLFAMTSDYEACSLTLIESLVAGTPVLVTDFPEAREAIVDGKSGFIVEKSPDAVGDMIIEVYENRKKLNDCKQYISDHPVTNEQAVNEFYEVVLGEQR